jgi:hypothetical protein
LKNEADETGEYQVFGVVTQKDRIECDLFAIILSHILEWEC